jgi:uncharacterized protein (TIGR02266 family)
MTDERGKDRRQRDERTAEDRRAQERRRWERVPVRLWAESTDGEATYFNQAADLSVGGIYFASAVPHPVGTVVGLKLDLPGGEPLECRGVVANAKGGDAGGMGVRFVDLGDDARARIEAAVAALAEEA